MENASKALLMAGSILIALLIIASAVYLIDKAKQMHGKELSKQDQELFINIKRTARRLIVNDSSLTKEEKNAVFRAIGMGVGFADKKPTMEINESENVTPEQQEAWNKANKCDIDMSFDGKKRSKKGS